MKLLEKTSMLYICGTDFGTQYSTFCSPEIFLKNGGFVYNTVHNIQANVPLENIIAMLEAVQEFNKYLHSEVYV